MIDSSSYEDELNILLDKLSKTISTFSTLSREQAESAILDTTSKIKEGESILQKIEQELEHDSKNRNPEELHEEKQKIKNYKTELNDLVNKFKIIQDNYIKKKENNALIDDEPKMKPSELLSNEENKNNFDINNEKSPKINKENKEKMICLKELEKKNTKLKSNKEDSSNTIGYSLLPKEEKLKEKRKNTRKEIIIENEKIKQERIKKKFEEKN